MKYKLLIWIFVFLLTVNMGLATRTFYDGFDRVDSETVGGVWTEGDSLEFRIANYTLVSDSGERGSVVAANGTDHLYVCVQYNSTKMASSYFRYQNQDSKTLGILFSNHTLVRYYDGAGYQDCFDYGINPGDWICIYTNSTYQNILYDSDGNERANCSYTTTYNALGAGEIKTDPGASTPLVQINQICASDSSTDDCFGGAPPPPPPENLSITAENTDGTSLTDFNVTIDGVDYTTTTGTITTHLLDDNGSLFDVTVTSLYHFERTYASYNVSSDLIANLTPYTKITVSNYWNSSYINDYNIDFNSTSYPSVNGVAYIDFNGTDVYLNITHEDYINKSLFINLTANLEYDLWQSVLNVNLSEKITNNTINSFTIQTNYENYTTTTGNITLYPNLANFNWNISSVGYLNRTSSVSVTEQDMNYTLIDMYSSIVNISADDKLGILITNFTINITYEDYGYTEIISTTTGNATFNLLNNTVYNISIDAPGYQKIDNQTLTVNSANFEYAFSLYTENSILFSFLNETLGNLLNNTTVDIDIIGDAMSVSNTTSNGTLFVDLLWPAEYIIRYSADGFNEKFYYFTVLNRSFSELELYLLENTSSTAVTAYVYDEINNLVENARIKVMKFDIGTNNYILEEMADTNWEGLAKLNLQLGTEFYYFILEYKGETKEITEPSYIYSTTLTFQILIDEPVGDFFFHTQEVDYTLGFNNNSNRFEYIYNDPNKEITQSCLEVYNKQIDSLTLINSSCQSGTSGTININVAPINGTTYQAKAYIYLDGQKTFISDYIYSFLSANTLGNLGIYLVWMLTILFACVGIWSIPVSCILAPLPWIFGVMAGLVAIEMWVAITAQIMGIIVAVIISKYT